MTNDRRKKPVRRGRPPAEEHERKDRLIQTRVEEDLDDALRAEAKRRRVTVSQLIRNVLHDTFQLVDDVISNTATLTEAVRRDARRLAASAQGVPKPEPLAVGATPAVTPAAVSPASASPAALAAVLAWQPVKLGQPRDCARCKKPLVRGADVFLGVVDDPAAPRPFVCAACAALLATG